MQKIKDLQNVGALCVAGKKSIFHILSNRMQPTRPAPPLEDPVEPLISAKPLIMATQAKQNMNSTNILHQAWHQISKSNFTHLEKLYRLFDSWFKGCHF